MYRNMLLLCLAVAWQPFFCQNSSADWTLEFSSSDFSTTSVFNDLTAFGFVIVIEGDLQPGVYDNPALVSVDYFVFGELTEPTPSGFPAFNLLRSVGGAEFYAQGSSLRFEIRAPADLSNGLQVAELADGFELNAREVGTGRYHPPVIELALDGTGQMQNSDNNGGVNPVTGMKVNVGFGDEYIVDLSFEPNTTTLADAAFLLGDVNCDGVVDLLDVGPFVDAITNDFPDMKADIDGSGSDDLLDVAPFVALLTGG